MAGPVGGQWSRADIHLASFAAAVRRERFLQQDAGFPVQAVSERNWQQEGTMFEVNNYVVKYNSGVCKVEDVLDGQKADFKDNKMYYLLIPLAEKSARIYIPLERGEKVLRRVLTYEEATELISRIPSIGMEFSQNDKLRSWNTKRRFRAWTVSVWYRLSRTFTGAKRDVKSAEKRPRQLMKNTSGRRNMPYIWSWLFRLAAGKKIFQD